MYLKIDITSELHLKLKGLWDDLNNAKARAWEFCQEMGANAYLNYNDYYGGIAGFRFDGNGIPDGWKRVREGCAFPKKTKANRELLDRIADLPKVPINIFPKAIGWELEVIGMRMITSPGIQFNQEQFSVNIPEGSKYVPLDGMIEITYTEYMEIGTALPF